MFVQEISPFHLAFPVDDLSATRKFYGGTLGCREGRSSDRWIDFDLFGHQIVAHLKPRDDSTDHPIENRVDGHDVPVPHFGVVLRWGDWEVFAERLKTDGVQFVIEPYVRFQGQVGEQASMFLLEPSGYALVFKEFKDPTQIFAK